MTEEAASAFYINPEQMMKNVSPGIGHFINRIFSWCHADFIRKPGHVLNTLMYAWQALDTSSKCTNNLMHHGDPGAGKSM